MKLYDKLHNVTFITGGSLYFQDSIYIIYSIDKGSKTVTLYEFDVENGPPRILTLKEFEQGLKDTDGLRHMIEIKED